MIVIPMKIWQITLPALVVLASVAVLAGLCSEEGEARTITVDDDGEGDYATIQDAVDAAEDGDTIQVWDGNYTGTVEVNKTLMIIGNGTERTRLNQIHIDGHEKDFTIGNLSLQGNRSTDVGIFIEKMNRTTIRNCSLENFHKGILVHLGGENSGEENPFIVADCSISSCGFGIDEYYTIKSIIIRCTIQLCDFGISLSGDDDTVDNCLITDNLYGVVCRYCESRIVNSTFSRNQFAIYGSKDDIHLKNNQFIDNGKNVFVHKDDYWEQVAMRQAVQCCFCFSFIVLFTVELIVAIVHISSPQTPKERKIK